MNLPYFLSLIQKNKIQFFKFLAIFGFLVSLTNYMFAAVYLPILSYSFYQINKNSLKNSFLDINFGFVFGLLLFFTWSGLSLFWTINFENGILIWIKSLFLALFAAYYCVVTSSSIYGFYKEWFRFVFVLYFIFVLFLFLEVFFKYPFIDFLFYSGIKNSGGISHMQYCLYKPLVTSLSMVFPAISLYFFRRFNSDKVYILVIICYIFSFVAIKFANALSATIGFFLGGLIFLLTVYYSKIVTEILKRFFVVYTIFLPFFSLYGLKNIYSLRYVFPPAIDNLFYRLCIWHFTSEKIAEKPILGWGLGASKNFPGGDAFVTAGVIAMPSHPHNNILQLYLELGVIGPIFYIYLMLFLFNFIQKNSKDSYALAAGNFFMVLTFIICNMSFSLWHMWYIAWFIICFQLIQIVNNMNFENSRLDYNLD